MVQEGMQQRPERETTETASQQLVSFLIGASRKSVGCLTESIPWNSYSSLYHCQGNRGAPLTFVCTEIEARDPLAAPGT